MTQERNDSLLWSGSYWRVENDGVLASIDGAFAIPPRDLRRSIRDGIRIPFSMTTPAPHELAIAVVIAMAYSGERLFKGEVKRVLAHAQRRASKKVA